MAADRNIVFRFEVDDKGAITNLKSMTKGISDIKVEGKNAEMAINRLVSKVGNIGKGGTLRGVKLTENELGKLQKSMHQTSAASGGAASSVLELGRVVSDAPYGIRGMANNVSQLASNMLFTAQQVDKTTGKVVGFGGVLSGMAKSFMGPLGILFAIQAVVAAVDFFWGVTKKAEESTKNLNKELKNQIEILKLSEEQLLNTNLSLEDRIKVLGALSKLDKQLARDLKSANHNKELEVQILSEYLSKKEDELAVKQQQTILDKAILDSKEKIAEAQEAYNYALERTADYDRIVELRALLENRLETAKEGVNKEFKKYLDLLKEEEGFMVGSVADFESQISELKKKQAAYSTIATAYNSYAAAIQNIQDKIDAITGGKKKKGGEADKRPDEVSILGPLGDGRTAEEIQAQRDKSSEFFAETLGITNDENMIKMETQMAFHQSMLNNETLFELKRTNTAKKGAEERKETQLKYLEAVGGGLQAMSQIAGEETAAGKALAVAGATIDTYAAISGVLANTAKTASGGIPGFAIAQAVTTGLFGLANVKKIIETSVPGGGGGVGGGGSIPSAGRTFDFNLAGSTGQNQLAQTIGGQVAQPIKAYVVSSEITNQQQFDNQIQGEVTIG